MAFYIQPQGIVKILRGVPFNSDRKHTRYYTSIDEQYTSMSNKAKYTVTDFTYMRHEDTIRVPISAENLYDCNYCMFQNVGFGNKWFFAFIENVQYINNNTSEITIDIDQFQTWLFDFTIGNCYVEREHVDNDKIGLHTVPEDISIGEHIVSNETGLYFGVGGNKLTDNTWNVMLSSAPSSLGTLMGLIFAVDYSTTVQQNQVVGAKFSCDLSSPTAAQEIDAWISRECGVGNDVTEMIMFPKWFMSVNKAKQEFDPTQYGCNRPVSFKSARLDEDEYTPYKPKNNKVYTYPYTYLKVSNGQGNDITYKWENFNEYPNTFDVMGYVGNGVSCDLRPKFYEGGTGRLVHIPIQSFPSCSFTEGSLLRSMVDIVGLGIKGGLSATSSTTTSSSSEDEDVFSEDRKWKSTNKRRKQKQWTEHKQYTTQSKHESSKEVRTKNEDWLKDALVQSLPLLGQKGKNVVSGNSGNLDIKEEQYGYTFYSMAIDYEYAKIVDNFFTRFGYKVCEFKVPNLNSRQRFNFIKTENCNIGGNIPDDAMTEICAMFDSGLTLWHTDAIEDYSQDNPIVG